MSSPIFKAVLSLCFLALVAACGTGPAADNSKTTHATGPTTVASSQAPTTEASSYKTEVFHGKEVFFPRQKYSGLGPLAQGSGKLVLDDEGCIRMKPTPKDPGFVPIWPAEFDLDTGSGEIRILNGKGRVVAKVGEEVVMGGGEVGVQKDLVDARTAQELRERCSGGGYWLVSIGVRIPRRG